MSFVHLHTHTTYSLLDGISHRKDLIKKAKGYGMPALAVTDHGALYNHMTFYQDCVDAQIKPILGMEAYVAPDSRFNRKYEKATDDSADVSEAYYHLILLAKNQEGYQNLKKLSTLSFREGFYHKPRMDLECIQEYSKGLIALSACTGSLTSQAIIKGQKQKALDFINKFRYIFGEDYFLELMNHESPDNKIVGEALIDFGKQLGIPTVITNDSHFTEKDDEVAHEVTLCLAGRKTLNDPSRWRFPGCGYWFKSPEEMVKAAQSANYPAECLTNSLLVANKIEDYAFKLKKSIVPKFRDETGNQWSSEDSHQKLVMMCWEGMERLGLSDKPEYVDRLNFELDMMERKNFSSYFLIIAGIIEFIRKHGGMYAPIGRGSSVGSLVCYALGIIGMDPIKWRIPFYRFINEGRKDLPDVDTDISKRHRGEVIDFIQRTYGTDRVAQIATFMQMGAKSAIDNVGRALDIPSSVRRTVSKMLGDDVGKDDTIDDLLASNKEAAQMMSQHQGWVDIAKRLQGVHRTTSVHAAGIVIANEAIDQYTPLVRDHEGYRATQYDMNDCAMLGLLKLDMLGHWTLDVIWDTIKLAKAKGGQDINFYDIPLDDPKVYKMLCDADFVSVFQYDSQGMRSLSRKLRPDNFELLMALNALYRPGPMLPQVEIGKDGKEHKAPSICDIYLERRHGRQQVETWHPLLDKTLADSYGMPLYQEQISEMSKLIAGFNDTEADEYRAAIGKKNKEKFDIAQNKFKTGGIKQGHSIEFMEFLASRLTGFARYGWNRGHAAGYSYISYVTAWLETYFPHEYYVALLNNNDDAEQITTLLGGIMQKGIEIRPPDINHSGEHYSTDGKSIFMGLRSIQKLGDGALAAILWDREQRGQYTGYVDFIRRVSNLPTISTTHPLFERFIKSGWNYEKVPKIPDTFVLKSVNKTVIENLVKVGGFAWDDAFTDKDKFAIIADVQKLAKKHPELNEFQVIVKVSEKLKHEEYSKQDRAAYEREVLNFYVSGHPATMYMKYMSVIQSEGNIITPSQLKRSEVHDAVVVMGLLAKKEMKTTKTNKPYISMKVQDQFGEIFVRVWSPMATELWPQLFENQIILVRGVAETDNFREGEMDIRVRSAASVVTGLPIKGFMARTDEQVSQVTKALGLEPTTKANVPNYGFICTFAQIYSLPTSIIEQFVGHPDIKFMIYV